MTREELEEGQMDCPKTSQGTITKANLDGYLVYKNEIILIVCRDDSEKKYILPISGKLVIIYHSTKEIRILVCAKYLKSSMSSGY